MTEAIHVILAAHRATPNGRTLLVDDLPPSALDEEHGIGRLSASGRAPNELWMQPAAPPSLHLAAIGAPRPARELYRVLASLERMITPGGRILILPYETADSGPENRFEATECFLGVFPGWDRTALACNVVELRKEMPLSTSGKYLTDADILKLSRQYRGDWRKVDLDAEPAPAPAHAGKRIISLAVWGGEQYAQYLRAYIRAHLTLFPGYELWVHCDETFHESRHGKVLARLHDRELIRLITMPSRPDQGKCERMLWRLAPAWQQDVEYVFARDLDALPTWRERCAVEEFLASAVSGESNAHTIHDSLSHCGLMGGLSGFAADALRALAPTFEAFVARADFTDERWALHGADQDYLNGQISNHLRIFEHSVFQWFDDDGKTRRYRKPSEWVGGVTSVRFATDIAPFEDPRVAVEVREPSNTLVPYLGVAGHDHTKATQFYDGCCPAIDAVRESEVEP